MAGDDWREWFRNWSQSGAFAHPDSPAGGSGPGFSSLPGPLGYPPPPSGPVPIPYPNSPAGQHSDWQSAQFGAGREDLARQIQEVNDLFRDLSDSFREALPDVSLRTLYDRLVDRKRRSYEPGNPLNAATLLQRLENHVDCFGPQLSRSSQSREFGLVRGKWEIVWKFGTAAEKEKLLNDIRVLAEGAYESTTKDVKKQWAEARRTGKQKELVDGWKARMLQHLTGGGGSEDADQEGKSGQTGQDTGQQKKGKPVGLDDPRLARAGASTSRTASATTATAVKTWIEFQLVDADGNPVPNAPYKVSLPGGAVSNGTLNEKGMVRFDGIDPGQCQITFPEFDAAEWKAK